MSAIPAPTGSAVLTQFVRSALSARLADGTTVIYQRDDARCEVWLRVLRVPPSVVHLERLLDPAGEIAVTGTMGCGSAVEHWSVTIGDAPDRAAALEAVPHLYAESRDLADRAALRSMYRYLQVDAVLAGAR